jgi:hypothetical protein
MSAVLAQLGATTADQSDRREHGGRHLRAAEGGAAGHPFADELLVEQAVPLLARRTAARALGLLLERSLERPGEPVSISGHEGAHLCGFQPRTWWLVKRRLLSLGHLVASTGGGPPSGRPGGRGRKGVYFVAPLTLARFREHEKTRNDSRETLNARPQTLNPPPEERNLSHHRSLRLLQKKRTSDVPSLEGDDASREPSEPPALAGERPSVASVWAWIRRETSERLRLGLLRLLETLLLSETFLQAGFVPQAPSTTSPGDAVKVDAVKAPPEGPLGARETVKERRPRAPRPLWTGERGEEASVLQHVRSILEWANKEHGATFDIAKSAKDTLRYPYERVRAAVANVLLKRARGYAFGNAGAVLWEGITLEGYKLEEFSVGPFDEVLARAGPDHRGAPAGRPDHRPPAAAASPPAPSASSAPLRFEPERQRRALLQALYEKLPLAARSALDAETEDLARRELGANPSAHRLALLKLDKRHELLAARSQIGPQESQISSFASARDESEPNVSPEART